MTDWMHRHDTVTVFSFRAFDPDSRQMLLGGCKATRDAIAAIHLAEPVPGTAEEVPLHALDAQGCFRRLPTGWGALG
jgi:hypothetical protein